MEPSGPRRNYRRLLGTRSRWATVSILVCVVPLLVWMLLPQNPRVAGLRHDDGIYVELGKNMLERGVYRVDHYPEPIKTAKYPPGVPLIAAVALAVTPDLSSALSCIRIINALFLVLALAAYWGILSREGIALGGMRSAGPALIIAVGWSSAVADYARVCMSEIPYLGVSLFTVLLLLRVEAESERPWRHAIHLASLCLAAFALRTFGLVLVFAVGAHLLLARRVATAVRFAVLLLPLIVGLQVFMSAQSTPAPGYEDVSVYGLPYLRTFLENSDCVGATAWTNALQISLYVLQDLVAVTRWLPIPATWSWILLWFGVALVVALVFLGARFERCAPLAGTKIRPWHILILFSLALMLPWPADAGRFVIPLTPFLLLMVVRGVESLCGTGSVLVTALVLCGASLGESIPTRIVQSPEAMDFGGGKHDVARLLEFSKSMGAELAHEDPIVASTSESLFAIHDGIRGVWGWTVLADRHVYCSPGDPLEFNLGMAKWRFVRRELLAAGVLYLERTKSRALPRVYSAMQERYGAPSPHRQGDAREPLLAALEQDAPMVREQFRRLGVTHAVLLLREGNPLYEILLARLVRRLDGAGRATLVPRLSSEWIQVWRIRP